MGTSRRDTTASRELRCQPFGAPLAIDLRHLRYFLAVFEELHFGRAAERLHIAQPPLSQAIRKLESELGVRLLERTSRSVVPTDAGTVFAEEARKVLAGFEVAVAEARRAGGAGAALRIGCVPHLPIERLLRFLGALHALLPDLRPQVTHIPGPDQVRRLETGDLDIGIFDHAGDRPELEQQPLFAGELQAVFLPREHPLVGRQALGPAELAGETLVLFPREANPGLHDRLLALVEEAGYRFAAVREAGGTNPRDVVLAVADGGGVALAPFSLREVSEAGMIVARRPLDPPVSMPDTVVAWRVDPPRRLEAPLAAVREAAAQLRGEGCGWEPGT